MVATRLRMQGVQRAMQEHGVAPRAEWLLHGATAAEDEFAQLETTIGGLIAGIDRPSAILCGNDKMAMRVIFILQRRGLRVPEDVSVVGFDDFRLISEALDPGLTTVALPYREIGTLAAHQALGGDQDACIVRVPCRPVLRGTLSAPAKSKGARR
jgi:LacI family transcriptional regulator